MGVADALLRVAYLLQSEIYIRNSSCNVTATLCKIGYPNSLKVCYNGVYPYMLTDRRANTYPLGETTFEGNLMHDYSVCENCGKSTTLDDYYKSADGKPSYKACKECVREKQRSKKRFRFDVPFHQTELGIIQILQAKGIPAVPGKMLRHSYVDVVAWGCVLIECKSSALYDSKGFLFGFTARQKIDGVRAHLTVLRCDYGGGDETYHLFRSDDPAFYKRDGKRKRGVHFQPYAKHRKGMGYNVLTKELMEAHENRWDMIELCRQQLSESIANGEQTWLSDWRVK